MASSPSRRPGFSRRAQYGLFAGYVIAIAGMLAGLLLALSARFDPRGHAAVQGAFADLTSPVGDVSRSIVAGLGNAVDGVAAYLDAGSKNRAMAAELRLDRTRLLQARGIERENARLRRLIGIAQGQPGVVVAAPLIGSTATSVFRFATLSAGESQGVASGQPVLAPDGLIGRVVAAGRITARVLLITDGGNVVPVVRVSDGIPALATGAGDGTLELRALEAGSNPFRTGDVFATSGAGGVYPPNVPVAVVAAIRRDAAIGHPFADPNRLDLAIVVRPYVTPDLALPAAERAR